MLEDATLCVIAYMIVGYALGDGISSLGHEYQQKDSKRENTNGKPRHQSTGDEAELHLVSAGRHKDGRHAIVDWQRADDDNDSDKQ